MVNGSSQAQYLLLPVTYSHTAVFRVIAGDSSLPVLGVLSLFLQYCVYCHEEGFSPLSLGCGHWAGFLLGPMELHTVALTFGYSGHCFDSGVIEMHLSV